MKAMKNEFLRVVPRVVLGAFLFVTLPQAHAATESELLRCSFLLLNSFETYVKITTDHKGDGRILSLQRSLSAAAKALTEEGNTVEARLVATYLQFLDAGGIEVANLYSPEWIQSSARGSSSQETEDLINIFESSISRSRTQGATVAEAYRNILKEKNLLVEYGTLKPIVGTPDGLKVNTETLAYLKASSLIENTNQSLNHIFSWLPTHEHFGLNELLIYATSISKGSESDKFYPLFVAVSAYFHYLEQEVKRRPANSLPSVSPSQFLAILKRTPLFMIEGLAAIFRSTDLDRGYSTQGQFLAALRKSYETLQEVGYLVPALRGHLGLADLSNDFGPAKSPRINESARREIEKQIQALSHEPYSAGREQQLVAAFERDAAFRELVPAAQEREKMVKAASLVGYIRPEISFQRQLTNIRIFTELRKYTYSYFTNSKDQPIPFTTTARNLKTILAEDPQLASLSPQRREILAHWIMNQMENGHPGWAIESFEKSEDLRLLGY